MKKLFESSSSDISLVNLAFIYDIISPIGLFDIERNSFVDGPGIRTTVFFGSLSIVGVKNPIRNF